MLDLLKQSSDTVVSRFVASAGDDPLRQRLRLSHLLGGADFRPSGMPVSSILLIRKLCDPSPDLLIFGARNGVVPPEWERGVRDSVGQLMRRAARPAAGEFTNCENAVLFSDRAELLACLARDWYESRIAERWWWRALLRNDSSFWTTWIRNPEYVPAAMEHLARANKVAQFAASLTEEEARTLMQQVVDAFALHHLKSLFESSDGREVPLAEAEEPPFLQAQSLKQSLIDVAQQRMSAPWRERVAEVAAVSLDQWQHLFVGLTLMISRAPALVRTASFAIDAGRWQRQRSSIDWELTRAGDLEPQSTSLSEAHLQDPVSQEFRLPIEIHTEQYPGEGAPESEPIQEGRRSADTLERADARRRDIHESPARKLMPDEIRRTIAQQLAHTPQAIQANEIARDALNETRRHISLPEPSTSVSEDENRDGHRVRTDNDVHRVRTDNEATDPAVSTGEQPESITSQSLEPEAFAGVEIETNLGGFFYLINLALYLELYGDFTRPTQAGLELNIWDFVMLVGNELVSDADNADPIFSLLGALAGRAQTAAVGEDFEPSDQWRLPVEWLSVFEPKRLWRWNVIDDRLRVCHADGFPVLDLAIESRDVNEQLNREIEPYRDFLLGLDRSDLRNDAVNCGPGTSSATALWLSRLMPYVRARLRAALGADGPEDSGAIVCRHHAIVRATETHVDVFFALSDHRIELRLAGLDRDPGWVPAAGRFISFHYN
jgi:hypothetical protein